MCVRVSSTFAFFPLWFLLNSTLLQLTVRFCVSLYCWDDAGKAGTVCIVIKRSLKGHATSSVTSCSSPVAVFILKTRFFLFFTSSSFVFSQLFSTLVISYANAIISPTRFFFFNQLSFWIVKKKRNQTKARNEIAAISRKIGQLNSNQTIKCASVVIFRFLCSVRGRRDFPMMHSPHVHVLCTAIQIWPTAFAL